MLRSKWVWLIDAGCCLFLLGCGSRAPALESTPSTPRLVITAATEFSPAATVLASPTTFVLLPATATITQLPMESPQPTVSPTSSPLPTLTTSPMPSPAPTFKPAPLPTIIVAPITPIATATATEPSPYPAPGLQVTTTPGALSADERHLAELINQERVRAGLAALGVDSTLMDVARARSSDMLTRNYFSHTYPVTQQGLALALLQQHGLNIAYGENLFKGGPYEPRIIDQAMQLFLADEPHRNIIQDSAWNAIGVGVTTDTSIVIITQIFGVR